MADVGLGVKYPREDCGLCEDILFDCGVKIPFLEKVGPASCPTLCSLVNIYSLASSLQRQAGRFLQLPKSDKTGVISDPPIFTIETPHPHRHEYPDSNLISPSRGFCREKPAPLQSLHICISD